MDCTNCLNKQQCNTNRPKFQQPKWEETVNRPLPKITSAFLIVTLACNLRCKYCFIHQQPAFIDLKVAIDAVDFLAKNAAEVNTRPSINFFGGEPTIMWDKIIVPVTNYVKQKYGDNFGLSMTSNGILLDADRLSWMKKNDIGLLFSIDGNKTTQDMNRPLPDGSSSFDVLEPKIPLVLEHYPNMTFRATIDFDSVYYLFDNYNYAISKGYTNMFAMPNVFAKWNDGQRNELKSQLRLVVNRYMELIRENKHVRFNPLDEMYNTMREVLYSDPRKNFRTKGIEYPAFGRCGLGANRFASIGTEGEIYSCQELVGNKEYGKDFIIGDIYNGTDDAKRWEIINKFDPRNVHSDDPNIRCIDCKMNSICNGACAINNYFATGDLNIMPGILCYWYQILLDEAFRVVETMAAEGNAFFKNSVFPS